MSTEDLLTIVVTTSPVPSAPSPDLIRNTIDSLPESLADVPIIITFDYFTISSDDQGRLKRGRVPPDLVELYPLYIDNVRQLFGEISCSSERDDCTISSSVNRDVTFLVLKQRHGFAFSVQLALDYVKTPYVLILQHDWMFTSPSPPFSCLLSILQNEPEVRYISFIARWCVNYERRGDSDLQYRHVFAEARRLRADRPLAEDLIACLHWFDRPHLCSVETYRQIFAENLIKRGDFIEDTFGTHYLTSIKHAPTRQTAFDAWKRWGAWLYAPDQGQMVGVRHVHGRRNLLNEREKERIERMIEASRA